MTSDRPRDVLDERAQTLLRLLVDKYIRDGQPVGSRTLSREPGLDLSPATIRNIVSDLEELGFVKSPHTSAGRVPTIKGYRFFVDTLIKLTPPKGDELKRFSESLTEASGDPQALALSVSNLLSAVTSLAGIVTVPRRAQTALRQIEFLPLSGHRVLAILVVNDREVQNKILNVSRDFGADELKRASNYLNEHCGGRSLPEVRDLLLAELKRTRASMNALMVEAIEMAQKVFPESGAGARVRRRGRNEPDGPRPGRRRRDSERPVRGVRPAARHPALARSEHEGRRRPDLHRPRVGI